MTTSNDQSPQYLSPRQPGESSMTGMAAGASPIIELNPAPIDDDHSGNRSVSLLQLLRYRWSILLVGVLGSAIGVIGVWASMTPSYSATATIEVAPVLPTLIGEDKVELYESYRRSLTDAMLDQRVLQRVIENPEIQQTDWYQDIPKTQVEQLLARFNLRESAPPIDRLRSSLRADAPSGKQLITVQFSTNTPRESQLIVNAVTREFVAREDQRASDSELERMRQLGNEIATREARRNALEARAKSIRVRVGMGNPESLVEQRLLRLDNLESRLLSLGAHIAALDAGVGDDATGESALEQSYENDPRWQELNSELETAQAALANAPDRFAAAHPLIKNLQQRVDYATEQLDKYVDKLTKRAAALGAEGKPVLDPEVQKLRFERDELAKLVAREKETYDTTFADSEELKSINDELEKRIEPLLAELNAELDKIKLNREVPGRIRPLDAYEPAAPTEDKRVKLSAAAIFGSFALAFGLAFIRLQLNKRVEDLGDVTPRAREVVLGYLPLQHGPKNPLDECPIHAESVRMVRTALLHQIQQHGSRILQISSASSGAGKTTLAILLSRSLAQVGQRVLLVDTDIRRPAVARRLKINQQPGLMDILLSGASTHDCLQQVGTPPVDVIAKGAEMNGAQVDALANGRFKHQLEEWRSLYDVVILDGPPMLGIADGAILARHADATIFVTREKHCRRDELEGAVNLLGSAGGRLLGFVFIGSNSSLSKYGYAYGYGYHPQSVYATTSDSATD